MNNVIGKNIYKLRRADDYSREGLAWRLGITEKELDAIESGNTMPDEALMDKIAFVFGIAKEQLNDEHLNASNPQASFFDGVESTQKYA